MCKTPECSQVCVSGHNLRVPELYSSAVSRRRSVEWLPGGDQRSLRAGKEDVTGPGTGLPTRIRVQLYLSLARKPLWPQRQFRSADVACNSGADKEVSGGESTWRTNCHVLGDGVGFA